MNTDKEGHIDEAEEVDTVIIKALDERSHSDVEVTVNRGIAVAVLEGVPKALKMMDDAGIPKNISLRVLNSKTRRRSSDWK